MNRESFLRNKWKRYPTISHDSEGLIFGRVIKLFNQSAEIKRGNRIKSVDWETVGQRVDSWFGVNCPVECLKIGDIVAFERNIKGEGFFFLLSPNLRPTYKGRERTNAWSQFIRVVEDFFLNEAFYRARTPYLVTSPGVDHHIDFLKVEASRTGRVWTLPTSPEINLKKIICQGEDRVFEIKTCFRDDLVGPQHTVEFEMLEWYRSYASLDILVKDISHLLLEIKKIFPGVLRSFQGQILKTTVKEQFRINLDFNLTPETTRGELFDLAEDNNLSPDDDDDWNTLFFRLFMEKVEPVLGVEQPQVIFDFPASQASLAQINDQGWAERFEFYWQGIELANAYLEVNDPLENEKRFEIENNLRKKDDKQSFIDPEFFLEMYKGMPPCSGIALGLERFYKLLMMKSELN